MAFVEITVEESSGGQFLKFDAIGVKVAGRYVSHEVKPSNFADGRPEQHYTFKVKGPDGQPMLATINAPTDLARKLEAALKSGALKPGVAVMMEYQRDVPATVAGRNPMKFIKTLIDNGVAAPGAPAAVVKPPPPPIVQATAPTEFDDIPM